LSNLDAKLRVQMRAEIKELHQRLRHHDLCHADQIEAMTMADRIIVLHDGMIEQIGSPLELYGRPATCSSLGHRFARHEHAEGQAGSGRNAPLRYR